VFSKDEKEQVKRQKEKEMLKREQEYVQRLNDELSVEEKRILKLQRQQLISIETSSLIEKHNLIRTREAALWELEHRQMDAKYNQMRKHVRDFFYLQRHLMLTKQEKDLEHLKQLNSKLEEDLQKRQIDERRLFLKSLRQEQRSRREMYRRSLYIVPSGTGSSSFHLSADDEKKKLKIFEEKEKERFESELQRLNIRHLKQLEDYKVTADNLVKDLEEEQVIEFIIL
jgi:STE20-like kinase